MTRRLLTGILGGLGTALLLWLVLLSPLELGGTSISSSLQGSGSRDFGSGSFGARVPPPAGARYLGLVAPSAQINFALSLRMRSDAMGRYATAVQQGRAPSLDAAQIGRRFGISGSALAGVRAVLGAAGVHIQQTFPQRTEMLVTGSAWAVQRLFKVRLARYVTGSGQHFRRPTAPPRVPRELSGAVAAPTMLDTTPLKLYEDVPQAGMTVGQLSALYDSRPLIRAGLDGAGMTVAVFSEDTFLQSDIDAFDRALGITGAPPVRRVEVQGQIPFNGDPGAAGEVDLDLDVIREMAPRAQILNYEIGGGAAGFAPAIDRVVRDGRAKLVNFSYGVCELLAPDAIRQADNSFKAAAVANVTVFVSSGDQGSYECGRGNPADHRLTVPWPASSAYVVSVGGTHVNLRVDGTRLDEYGWENVLSRGGGGGGLSGLFPRPSWQGGSAGVQNQYSNGMRQVPDVAAAAAPSSGYGTVSQGQVTPVGGTSAAAPLWTGAMVLIDEYIKRRTGHLLPFIAPLLYRVAARDPAAFYDVKLGGNRYYRAGPGWDYATGLGTPDFTRIANDLFALIR